ncbi:PEP-CTERM sorting domain-containing protein [Niveibacterium sp.]|uniref:PEP-CTERM sorting domain-containing protein n=1 Tax=Niveibacterium sp. TaxID=2017444 RepID=UPI0035AEF784
MNLKSFALVLSIAAFVPEAVMAASGTADVDWSRASFTTVATEGSLTYTWSASSYVWSSANGAYDSNFVEPNLTASSANGSANASAAITPTSWNASSAVTPAGVFQVASSGGERGGNLNITGTGFLLVSVPYSLEVSTVGGGDSWAQALLRSYVSEGGYTTDRTANAYLSSWTGAATRTGVLHLALYSDGAYSGWLSSSVYSGANVAAVPEPESYAMMLSGLALFGVIARKRRRA